MSVDIRPGHVGVPVEQSAHRPLYARALGLRHLNPGGLLCFLFFEGSLGIGILLALAEMISWWGIFVLPTIVAAMVKINDLVAGPSGAPGVPAGERVRRHQAGYRGLTAVGRARVVTPPAASDDRGRGTGEHTTLGFAAPAILAQARAATTAARYDTPRSAGQRYGNAASSSSARFGTPVSQDTGDGAQGSAAARDGWPAGDTSAGAPATPTGSVYDAGRETWPHGPAGGVDDPPYRERGDETTWPAESWPHASDYSGQAAPPGQPVSDLSSLTTQDLSGRVVPDFSGRGTSSFATHAPDHSGTAPTEGFPAVESWSQPAPEVEAPWAVDQAPMRLSRGGGHEDPWAGEPPTADLAGRWSADTDPDATEPVAVGHAEYAQYAVAEPETAVIEPPTEVGLGAHEADPDGTEQPAGKDSLRQFAASVRAAVEGRTGAIVAGRLSGAGGNGRQTEHGLGGPSQAQRAAAQPAQAQRAYGGPGAEQADDADSLAQRARQSGNHRYGG